VVVVPGRLVHVVVGEPLAFLSGRKPLAIVLGLSRPFGTLPGLARSVPDPSEAAEESRQAFRTAPGRP
jgi:hypothetical protein